MTGITEIIVGMWLVPVTLFIIVPLVMFAVWHLGLRWVCGKSFISLFFKDRGKRKVKPHLSSTA